MTRHKLLPGVLFVFLLVLAACQSADTTTSTTPDISGQIIFWRIRGNEVNEQTWQNILTRFEEIYPQVTVIQSVFDEEEYRERVELTTGIGVGPDLFIARNEWITEMAQADLIRQIVVEDLTLDMYLSGAMQSLRYEDELYGLPISLKNNALYYNPTMVETPATTLEELLQQAQGGTQVTITSTFDEAFWGIQAFGGRIFDENNQLVFAEGGLANWLSWLDNAQDEPGMIVNSDKLALRQLFAEGNAAYYVGAPDELAALQEEMGAENVAVALLPAGPQGPAGPLLNVEALLFGPNSSAQQQELALLFALFITNSEQQTTLLRETGRIPANTRVLVDSRIYPHENSFTVQSRTAVALPNVPQTNRIRMAGNDLNRSVISGRSSPADAVIMVYRNLTGEEIVAEDTLTSPAINCGGPGTVTVAHSLPETTGQVLADVAAEFSRNCPGTNINIERMTEEELLNSVETIGENRPEIVLISQLFLDDLVNDGNLLPITGVVDEAMRQRFFGLSLNSLFIGNELYGLPFSLEINTLYRNLSMAADAPVTLDDLLLQVNNETPFAMPVTGRDAFWGISAHTEMLFDEDGRFLPDPRGLVDWLTWLETNQNRPGMLFGDDHEAVRNQFDSGEVALYVGRSVDISFLLDNLSFDNIRTASLPSGPAGPGRSLLIVQSFLFTTAAENEFETALAFVDYATSNQVQTELMNRERLLPANINISLENFPHISVMQAQAQNAVLLPHGFPIAFAREEAAMMYNRVLNEEQTPAEAACEFVLAVNEEMGFSLTLDDLGPSCVVEE